MTTNLITEDYKLTPRSLSKRLGYTFKNPALLQQALTHCSVGSTNNERYEFLGDSILNFIIAHILFDKFPEKTEGELSRLRAFLVKGEMLAKIATEITLGDAIILGAGELRSGGFRRASILADALEAIIAAVFLDGGITASQELVLKLYHNAFLEIHLQDNFKDPKTELQEYLQAAKQPLPTYALQKITGAEHNQIFYVICTISNLDICATGQGANRRKAEQDAAAQLLQQLKK